MSKQPDYLTQSFPIKYPTIKRAQELKTHTPYQKLVHVLNDNRSPKNSSMVVHWFRNKDLRIQDNKSLYHASMQAKNVKKPLICIYVYCAVDLINHGISTPRTDFILEALKSMQTQLKKLKIPLVILETEKAEQVAWTVIKFLHEKKCSHLYANYEYEFNELKRDIEVVQKANKHFSVHFHHDQSVIKPGTITGRNKKPLKVFTAYLKSWLDTIRRDSTLLSLLPDPLRNDDSCQEHIAYLFNSHIPKPPPSKQFAFSNQKEHMHQLWPASHKAGILRIQNFLHKEIDSYHLTRNTPAADCSSRMSPYFSAGLVSVRDALSRVKEYSNTNRDASTVENCPGIFAWMREIAFRDLYRQRLTITPHIAMNLPENLNLAFVKWQYDKTAWTNWCEGRTGVPFIDAGMRQLKKEAYMHNRLRMNVASYLYCNLFIDYRLGERFFAEHLIDYDLANNIQGWQPSFTVFNPITQAEKYDPKGEYIRKWVPELKQVRGKAVFDPYNRLSQKEFEALGYPKPYVDWKSTKLKAIATFKQSIQKMKQAGLAHQQ